MSSPILVDDDGSANSCSPDEISEPVATPAPTATQATSDSVVTPAPAAASKTVTDAYKNDAASRKKLMDEITNKKVFLWKKTSVRSANFDNMLHIFSVKNDEKSYLNYVQCQICFNLVYNNSTTGNKAVIAHNKLHQQKQPDITLFDSSKQVTLNE